METTDRLDRTIVKEVRPGEDDGAPDGRAPPGSKPSSWSAALGFEVAMLDRQSREAALRPASSPPARRSEATPAVLAGHDRVRIRAGHR
jgi:hypothetical protein